MWNCKRQQEQDYWDAFRDGFRDSWLKQSESFTGFLADLFTGKGTENWYEYGEKSAYGQAEQIGGWTEIGTKTSLVVASISAGAALVGGGGKLLLSVLPKKFLTIETNMGTHFLRILSKSLRRGFRIDKAAPHKPFIHMHY